MAAPDVMVDLETLGRRAGCVILSVGAVRFDPERGRLGARFYKVASVDSQLRLGLTKDPKTEAWWDNQLPEARRVLLEAQASRAGISRVLKAFNKFVAAGGTAARVWGNGADFDNAILHYAMAACGIEPSWSFWNNRCFRTLKNLRQDVKAPEREGTAHNALNDAVHQARHAMLILADHCGSDAGRPACW